MLTIRPSRLIAFIFAISLGWPLAGAAPPQRPPAEGPQTHFDGYVWLDASGEPLSFQSDAEIEEFLRTAEVTDSSHVGTGITMPRQTLLTRDGVSAHAIFKDVEMERHKVTERTAGRSRFYLDWRDSHIYDNAAYHVDRLLGLYRVPPAVRRRMGGASGTMVMWIEGTMNEAERRRKGLEPPDAISWRRQMQIMHVFNNLIAKRDINPGNTLIDTKWRVWFIDSTRAFGTVDTLLYPEAIKICERKLWNRLQALEAEEVRERLKPYLSRNEIRALLTRRDKLVDHISGLIDENGEAAVLFELAADQSITRGSSHAPEAEGNDENSS